MKFLLLTGATGLVGSFLLRDGLSMGMPMAVLVRGPHAQQRVDRHLKLLGGDPLNSPKVIQGDLSSADAGLSGDDTLWLREHCDRVLHCAGVVKFRADGRSGEPYRTNLDGTRNLLRLCTSLNIRQFHHVSTAYVCGDRPGPVLEDQLDCGQSFHNDYERSKFLAEVMITQASDLEVRRIYRPSVVLGEASTGFTPAFHGAYELLWAGWLKVQQGLDRDSFLRYLHLQEKDSLNLVTADWVSQVIWQLVQQAEPGLATFHLTNPRPTAWADLYDTLLQCAPAQSKSGSEPEEAEFIEAYSAYLKEHPVFDATRSLEVAPHLPCPPLDPACLNRLTRYAIESDFQAQDDGDLENFLATMPVTETTTPTGIGLVLEVAGLGSWSLGNDLDGQAPRVFCSGRTLQALRQRRYSLEQALYCGQLVLEGSAESFPAALSGLEQVLGL